MSTLFFAAIAALCVTMSVGWSIGRMLWIESKIRKKEDFLRSFSYFLFVTYTRNCIFIPTF